MMPRLFWTAPLLTACALLLNVSWIHAQTSMAHSSYPARPLRIVTGETGNTQDWVARAMAASITQNLGQRAVVDNRPSGPISGNIVAKAAPDGYTLLITSGIHWIGPLLNDGYPFDSFKDFAPISMLAMSPNVLVVPPSLPVKSVSELIALAKAKPGELNYATSAAGSSTHLAAELFRSMAKADMVRVAYRGTGPALIALTAGQIQMMFPNAGSAMPQVQAGKLRGLGVSSPQSSPLAPGLPAIASAGVPGYESVAYFASFAPAGTPAAAVTFLHREFVRILETKENKEKFFNTGVDVVASSPQQLVAAMKNEVVRLGKVIKEAGIRGE